VVNCSRNETGSTISILLPQQNRRHDDESDRTLMLALRHGTERAAGSASMVPKSEATLGYRRAQTRPRLLASVGLALRTMQIALLG
jgi:hypothetical protein